MQVNNQSMIIYVTGFSHVVPVGETHLETNVRLLQVES
jgi:hypothetical protein